MRKLAACILIGLAAAVMSLDGATGGTASRFSPDFNSLAPFVKGFAFRCPEIAVYRVKAASVPVHSHPKPFVIVWTRNGSVTEERDGAVPTNRVVNSGQIDFYPSGTEHSLHSGDRTLHFTMVELQQQNHREPEAMPRELRECESVVEFPDGGFACLIRIAPDQQVTIPQLDENSVYIAIESGRIRTTIPGPHSFETHSREGRSTHLPGYEKHDLRNLGRMPIRLVLIVPPTAK